MEWKLGHGRWRFWSRAQQHPTRSRVILFICVFCFHSLQRRQENLFSERLNSSASRSTERSSLVFPHEWEAFLCQPNWLRDNNFTPFMRQLRWQFPESCNIYLKYLSSLVTDQRNATFGNDFQLTWSCWSRAASEVLGAHHWSADRKTTAKGEASDSLTPCKL